MTRTDVIPEVDPRDGRVERGARNRERIVEALFGLVREGMLVATAEQVAERAQVATRTVFRHFADMESLYVEMSARIEREVAPLLEGGTREGSLEDRTRAMVDRRANAFERIAPFKRAGNLQRWHSTFLQTDHASMVRGLRADLIETLPELSGADSLIHALELVTSFEAWDRLRSDQRLGRERAREVVEAAALALVGAALAADAEG